jgi:hypothetical protein
MEEHFLFTAISPAFNLPLIILNELMVDGIMLAVNPVPLIRWLG